MLRIATVFSGIGAPEEALRQLNIPFETIFACDNGERDLELTYDQIIEQAKDKTYEERLTFVQDLYKQTKKQNYVKMSYFANHSIDENHWFEDVRFIDGERYANQIDILIGGSPCQSFSTYGKKQGFEDARGTLFFFYAKLIEKSHPKVFIYENVPGLLSHDKGNTWKRIKEIFDELDYDIKFEILNAADYGLPQYRSRIFVVGFAKRLGITNFEFPQKIKLSTTVKDFLDAEVDLKYYLGKKGFEWVTEKEKHQGRSRVNRDIMCCQTANQQFNWTGDFRLEKPTERTNACQRIYIGQYQGEKYVARKLTPAECLRLMGFEDFKQVVNDINLYRQSGNSIAVPVLKSIFTNILTYLEI